VSRGAATGTAAADSRRCGGNLNRFRARNTQLRPVA